MPVIKPDNNVKPDPSLPSLFLAGSIEMGKAEKWQDKVGEEVGHLYNIYNPRRDDWDNSWDDESRELRDQIFWEQKYLGKCDCVLFYFDPDTKSPITLLELGQALEKGLHGGAMLRVVCPKGFWRWKNVQLTCAIYQFDIDEDLDTVIKEIKDCLE